MSETLLHEPPRTHNAPPELERVFAMRRDELNPQVRDYADNLHGQILAIFREHGARNFAEFRRIAQEKFLSLEILEKIQELTNKLEHVITERITPEQKQEMLTFGLRLIEDSKETTKHVPKHAQSPELYTKIAKAEVMAGLDPKNNFAEAVRCTKGVNRLEHVLMIAEVKADCGLNPLEELTAARHVAQKEAQSKKIKNKRTAAFSFLRIAETASRIRQPFEDSLDRAEEILEQSDDPMDTTYFFLRKADMELHLKKDARGSITKAKENARALQRDSAEGFLLRLGNLEANTGDDIRTTVNALKVIARELGGVSASGRLFLQIIEIETTAGRFDDAQKTATEIEKLEELREAIWALLAIVEAQVRAQQDPDATIAHAKDIAHTMQGTSRDNMIGKIAETEARLGNIADAWDTLNEIEEPAPRVQAMFAIARQKIREEEDPEDTIQTAREQMKLLHKDKVHDMFYEFLRFAQVQAEAGLDSKETFDFAKRMALKLSQAVVEPWHEIVIAEAEAAQTLLEKARPSGIHADAPSSFNEE